MGDVFKEQIVKKLPTKNDRIKKGAIIGGVVVISAIAFLFVTPVAIFVFAVLGLLAYFYIPTLDREYEYIFTNGELDIDCIMNKSKRKRVFNGRAQEFELMITSQNKEHEAEFQRYTETIDCGSSEISESTFYILTAYKGKRVKVIFEPNEEMLHAFSSFLTPRKLIKK